MIYDDQTSSAMNYYEELGISPQATEQEIRKAHRRLVKLMHPDAQPDQRLKILAETQMRRLNSIVSTLLDPEQRRKYDEHLQSSYEASQRNTSVLATLGGIPWWMTSSVAAIILTLGAVWIWADHLGNRAGTSSGRNIVYVAPEKYPTLDGHPPVAASSNPYSSNGSGADGSVSANLPPPSGSVVSTVVSNPTPPSAPKPEKPSAPLVADNIPPAVAKPSVPLRPVITPEVKKLPPPVVVATRPEAKSPESKPAVKPRPRTERQDPPAKALARSKATSEKPKDAKAKDMKAKDSDPPAPALPKQFAFPAGTLVASAAPRASGSQLPVPPGDYSQNHYDSTASVIASPLPAAAPPKAADVATAASPAVSNMNRDPLEGEWIYAPKEPERRRAGFYPPEYIDLKIFGSGDPGMLKGQYEAKYVVTDRPVSPEISFQLASISKGSRKFVWQSTTGAKGTLNIEAVDERTIRIDWHTTSAIRGPALTAGQATLVRRQ